jgi:hypothetical protein
MSNILTGFNMQGNDPIDDRIVSKSNLETLEQYLNRVPVQKRYYGLTFFALDKNNELRKYTFQTSLINPTIDDYKELQEHVSNKAIHKTSEEIRSEIVDADIPDTISRVQWTLDQINTAVINLIGGASDEYNTLKRIQTKIEELRAKIYGDDGGTVLNTLEQALKFLNQYKDFIVDIPENFVNKQDIVDNLTTDDPTKVLSAKQGKVLSDTLTNYFESAMQSIRTETDRAINAENRIEAKLDKEIERSTNEDIRIDNKLDSEINRSTAEDDRLDKKIDAETTRATTAESNLNTKIETETGRAEGEESRIETKLDNEITRSTNKDTEHDNRLQALEGQTHEQNTDLGTTNSTFQLKYNTGNKIKHESDAISVRNAADTDYVNFIAKNATFKGDLLVEGQSFVTEAETVEIKDNLLLLNKGEVGAGVTKGIAGLEIDRGTEPNYFIIFDESDNRFKAGVEGDLWNLALRESDDNMLDGYFISWNSKDKILSTTNIVNESTPLLFGRTDYKQYSGNRTDPDGNYSSYAFISEAEGNHLYNFSGSSNWNIDTDKINFRFWKPLLGTTFKRASDNSEVLYHADIVNNLTSGGTNKVLSAEQGKLLQNSITSIQGSYLPLSGGTMTGSIIFPNRKGIFGTLTNGTSNIKIAVVNANNNVEIGNSNTPLMLVSNSTDLTHYRDNNTYEIWDKFNLSDPATSTDLNNYLPLAGGTLTGQVTIQQNVDIKLRLQSTDADNYCIIQAINSQASQLGVFGYAGDKWAIGHNGTYYEIWDKYNLSNPVTYTTNTYNHATLKNKNGQYFTYIKAGTNGLLPHSQVTLTSGGSGSLGTSDQGFNAAYINHLYTNKISFGVNGPYIIGSTSATQFLDANGGVQKVATGGLYVGPSYASDALALVPSNGIYSQGNIRTSGWLTFEDNEWTDTGWAYKEAKGSIKVLSVINEVNNKPTSYGSVLQFNSRQGHWCTQIWCDQTNAAGVIGTLRFRTTKSYASTEWNPWTSLVTEFDLNSYLTKTEASTLYYPYNGRGYLSITSTGKPVMSNNQGYAVKDKDGNEREVLWMGTNNALYLGNTSQYTLGQLDLRCTTLTHNGNKIATQNYVTNQLSNYLPLTGGTMTGALTMSNRRNNVVVDVVGGAGQSWDEGAGALSVQVPNDSGQTPLLLARRSGAAINTAVAAERLLSMELLDTGHSFIIGMSGSEALQLDWTSGKAGTGKLFGKTIATTDQIPSIPSISISNSGSGNAVTAISASGHTLTVTKGATYLTSHQTIYDLTFQAGTFSAKTFDPNGAAATVNIPTKTSHITNDSGFITSSALSGYATQSWANGQFAPLKNYFVTNSYASIATTGNEMCIGSLTSGNSIINVNYRNGTGTTSPSTWYWRAGSSTSWANAYWGNLYMNDNLVATQSWASGQFPTKTGTGASGTWGISISGNATTASTASKLGSTTIGGSAKPIYLSSGTPTACSATVGSATVPVYMNAGTITQCSTTLGVSITGNAATATNATQLGGTAASSYVKANDNISRLTNDSGYTTQEWVNEQGFLTSDSLLDKFLPTTGGYIRNSDQVLLRLQRTGVSTGTSRTIEMYFDDSNTDGTSTTPRGSIGYNSEVGMFLYSAASKKFLAMEYTGRPFYGTPENRYYLLGSNTQYHNLDGYQRIGDIMIQWGYFTVQGNSTRAVNFPVSFTNTVWSVTGSWDNTTTGGQENWGFTDYTSSGFTIINGDGSSRVFHYIAIGPFTRS